MIDLVGKIGSMALISRDKNSIDENIFARIGDSLKPGMIWVTSGAVEVGRLDYMDRNGVELTGDIEDIKTDYASQGQAILMGKYRRFINKDYSLRQILVEHTHFNDAKKCNHIKGLLIRAATQNAIPIVNYNDAVSREESRRLEIRCLKEEKGHAIELVDNDETASQIACLVNAKVLLILSTLDGIYQDIQDSKSLIREITGTKNDVIKKLDLLKPACKGASRSGANGASSKLEFIKPCIKKGTKVIIASAKYNINDILNGTAPSTMVFAK